VYLISGGFREMALPVAKEVGVPSSMLYANRMFFTLGDDDTTEPETETEAGGGSGDVLVVPTKFAGFDKREPTSRQGGKPQVIRELREKHVYDNVVMVGDGITDLEATQGEEGGADCFIGYGGNVIRKEVAENADWLIRDFDQLYQLLERKKICFIGSGAWACAAAKLAAANAKRLDVFEEGVEMWVYEEDIDGRKLTEIINETSQNSKYLPNISIGENVHAEPELLKAVQGANVLVLCCPHEFVHGLCNQLQGYVRRDAIAISLTKGMRIRPQGPQLISEMVRKKLGIDCSVLMGANIALDIGLGQLSEATIGFKIPENADVFAKLFQSPTFNVTPVQDVEGAEMCGTLKNIVAVAAGLSDGLDYGSNTKAAIIRQGLSEIRLLSKKMFPSVRDETFLESCGVADLVASCYDGRNRRVAEAFARNRGEISMEKLAESMLGGQKLQGALTANEVQQVLTANGWTERDFPLFTLVWQIAVNRTAPVEDVTYFMHTTRPTTPLDRDGVS
jgi:glycerol-3-phosphate dehydrogenase (NAD+)